MPHIFQEDYFDVLDIDQRPPYRWFIIGPERSGASWHVDPGLTSAWNTLLYGRKRSELVSMAFDLWANFASDRVLKIKTHFLQVGIVSSRKSSFRSYNACKRG